MKKQVFWYYSPSRNQSLFLSYRQTSDGFDTDFFPFILLGAESELAYFNAISCLLNESGKMELTMEDFGLFFGHLEFPPLKFLNDNAIGLSVENFNEFFCHQFVIVQEKKRIKILRLGDKKQISEFDFQPQLGSYFKHVNEKWLI